MAETYFVGGKYANFLKRLTATPSSSADSDYPVANLVDELPASFFRFAAAGADKTLTWDLDQFLGLGTAESGSLTPGSDVYGTWVQTDGDALSPPTWAATSAGTPSVGTYHIRYTSGGSLVADQLSTRVPVRSGHYYTITAAGKGNGVTGIKVRLQDRITGSYLDNAGAWQTSATNLLYVTAAAYSTLTPVRFLVPAAAATRWDHAVRDLKLILLADVMGVGDVGYVDNITLTPDWDTFWITGHNLESQIAPQFRSSTDNFAGVDTLESALTLRQPTMYYARSSYSSSRYVRLKLSGTSIVPSLIGEVGLGKRLSVTRLPSLGLKVGYEEEVASPIPGVSVGNTDFPPRSMEFLLDWFTAAQYAQWRDLVFGECRGGRYPAFLVPDSTDDELAMYGRISPGLSFTKTKGNTIREQNRVIFTESYAPTVVTV